MGAEEIYLCINDKLCQLEWCQDDIFEKDNILREIYYALGSIR